MASLDPFSTTNLRKEHMNRHVPALVALKPGGHHMRRLLLGVVFVISLALIAPPAFSYPDGHYTPTLKQEPNGSELGGKLLHGIRARLIMHNRVWPTTDPDGPAGGKEYIIVEDLAADGRRVAAQWQVLTAGTQGVITKGICVNAAGYGLEQSLLCTASCRTRARSPRSASGLDTATAAPAHATAMATGLGPQATNTPMASTTSRTGGSTTPTTLTPSSTVTAMRPIASVTADSSVDSGNSRRQRR